MSHTTTVPAPGLSASSSSSMESTPDANVETPLPSGFGEDRTELFESKVLAKEPSSTKMGPPSVPLNVVAPTPTRMTRLPSLKQLSDRLHSSSVSGQTSTPSASPSLPVHGGTACKPSTPPILQVSTSTSQLGSQTPTSTQLNTSPFTASPSSRLRLPASAMLRGSSGNVPTIALLSNLLSSSTEGTHTPKMETASHGLFANPDPFASPLNSLKTPASMSRTPSKDGYIEGYKDMPSLAAIRNRVSYSRDSSVSGPEPQDPKEASVKEEEAKISPVESVTSSEHSVISGKEHPLQHAWTLYYDSKTYKPDTSLASRDGQAYLGDYEKGLLTVGRFETVEGFARHLNNVRLPSQLARNSNYHLFKNGIRPMWEDPANANGGKWVILFRNSPYLLDQAWANLTMALVGEILDPDDEVCGVVASTRPKIDRVQVWTRDREDVDKINSIGKRIVEIISLEGRQAESMSLEFQWNASNSTPAADRYYNIPFPMAQPQSQRSSMPHAPPTPSRLGHNLTPNPGNISPIPPRSPTSGEFLIPMQFTHSGGMSVSPRRGTSGGINAFAGPMGGGVRNGSLGGMGTLGRRDSSQSIGGVTAGANR